MTRTQDSLALRTLVFAVMVYALYTTRYELALAISIGIVVWAVLGLAVYLRRSHASS